MNTVDHTILPSPFGELANWLDATQTSLLCVQTAQSMQACPPASATDALNTGRRRAKELIAFARAHSPLYKNLYSAIPSDAPLEAYPPVCRSQLMDDFDNWATDRQIDEESSSQFLSSKDRIAHRYLGKYLIWTSSGTTGQPGVYIQDKGALATYQSLLYVRYRSGRSGAAARDFWPAALGNTRMAMVAALEGHFAGVVFWEWARQLNPWLANSTRCFSILQPLDELVAQLNDWQPGFLSSYPSMLSVLATEQELGRLQLTPHCLWSGGEGLSEQQRLRIEEAFGCELVEDYGASEAMNMGFGCEHSRLHLNADWFVLEPVDAQMRPVKAGQTSTTTLVTNLANRVQPIIRYDIGDSVTLDTDPCPCGNPLPTFSVCGRNDETLWLTASNQTDTVPVLPLALNTIVEEQAGEHNFQLIQTGPASLSVRTEADNRKARQRAFDKICACLTPYFASIGAAKVDMQFDNESPERDTTSGKLRQVTNRCRQGGPEHFMEK